MNENEQVELIDIDKLNQTSTSSDQAIEADIVIDVEKYGINKPFRKIIRAKITDDSSSTEEN